jgi:gliding motility-associated-like protein
VKKKSLPLLLLLLFPAGAFAQLQAVQPGYSDSTKYRASTDTLYKPLSKTQDKIFVFFNRYGKLTAAQPQGRPVRFTWQKLDTASLTFQTIWVDTVKAERREAASALPDSVGFGCYRVVTDTLPTLYEEANALIAKDTLAVAADTFCAWVFVDTFRVDSIAKVSQDCNLLNLQAQFYPPGINEGYYSYTYLDLWRTPRKEKRDYPDCQDCYIKSVEWTTTPDDIHKGADVDDGGEWKRSYNPYIPTPFYDAKYKIAVENYFGAKDTSETDAIEAISTCAQVKLYVEKPDKNGVVSWEEKTNMEEPEQSPASVYLANTSINAKDPAFTWTFFANLYEQEDTSAMPPPLLQASTTDSAEAVYPPEPYKPGRYSMALRVVNRHGCTDSDTITLEVEEYLIKPEAIPPLFTPNSDGKNDVYQLKDPEANVRSLASIEISIFNRYGQLVFYSRDALFAWDGKLRGTNSAAPDGVYFYVIKAQGYSKQRKKIKQTLKGSIHLFSGGR